ncbi:MAG: CBS domain-containing protein, partial [Phycisphaerae bacterium]|nr:CBS domain-containing protein [Phycisphaerae bacterium]
TITDRDITIRVTAEGLDPTTTSVSEAMTEGVVHCREDESIERAAELMEERQIRRLVVVDEDNRPVGIVSLGDLAVRVHDDRLTGEVTERVSEPAKIRR